MYNDRMSPIPPIAFLNRNFDGYKFIQKSLDNTSSKLQTSLRSHDMNEEKFWLMKSERD